MPTAAERERIALEAAAAGPRSTGRRLTELELHRLVLHRLLPRLAQLLERPDPGPIPGPPGIVT